MRQNVKKMLITFMCICMLITMMPASAFATDGDGAGKETSVGDYGALVERIAILEELAEVYVAEMAPGKDPTALVIKYIRTGVDRYNSGSWGIMAGYEDEVFAQFVTDMEDMIYEEEGVYLNISSLKNIKSMEIPNGQTVDFGHMFGTMDITYHNNGGVNHADVGGWAGDLVDLLSATDRHHVTGTLAEMTTDIRNNYLNNSLGGEADSFGLTDMYGDLDAFYVMTKLYESDEMEYPISTIMAEYFTEELTDEFRAKFLIQERFEGVDHRADLREAVYKAYTGNSVVSTLEGTRDFETSDLTNLRKACCYAFADYICELGGDYVEVPENSVYTVFQSEETKLAPGITQKISKATAADGKQMVFYTATVDINREDVNVYANYTNNDPTKWAMSRVEDQMRAAQNKYGDPASEHYIENYNVIAGINGAGYNMETGEPGGLLVMGGKEYHGINANGFFGILKDGTPIIGTTAEYNNIYKGQLQEGIAGFGSKLVTDGKVVATDKSSRASRTAVGITKTGKVVFMVLDGRQEPVSCGGNMVEIAQIMLEAGCVEAVNLDGGGSTTYVAKQPGDETFGVVSSPSDGFARSVSTSLMAVSTAKSSTAFDHAALETETKYLTLNNTIEITAKGISATGDAAELPEGTRWDVDDARWGTITEDGKYTAHRMGSNEVYLKLGDQVIGQITIECVAPNKVYFTRDNIDLVYGSSTELPIKMAYNGKDVAFRAEDVAFKLSNDAGRIDGFKFTAAEESTYKKVIVTAALVGDDSVTDTINVSLYKQGEATFDFDKATSGDRMFAWMRNVSNSVTSDNVKYDIIDINENMETSYVFALDMTQIPIPEQLADLTFMLPGADMENASAWNFLLQLAERVSVLTEVKPVVYFDKNFEVDYSDIKVVNEYFTLTDVKLNEEENSLTLTLKWNDQTKAIDPATANPMCILSGVKLIPKDDAEWSAKNQLKASISGKVSYDIYLRASALYSFAQKPENQEKFGLYPFTNPDVVLESGAVESGGHFESTYVEFIDSFTLDKSIKNGWINENGNFYYYKDGTRLTGIQEVDGYYYDFGDKGICDPDNKYTGFIKENDKTYYARIGKLIYGWNMIGNDWYFFDKETGVAATGKVKMKIVDVPVTYEFDENGKIVKGYWFHHNSGKTYYYYGPTCYKKAWVDIEGARYFFDENGHRAENGAVIRLTHGQGYEYHLFDKDGKWTGFAEDANGLMTVGNDVFYFKNGLAQCVGLVQDSEGNYYYINSSYRAVKNCRYAISKGATNGLLPAGSYEFGADGKMVDPTVNDKPEVTPDPSKQGLVKDSDGKIRYYVDGIAQYAGIVKDAEGNLYYINSSKTAVTNCTYSVGEGKTNGLVPAGIYSFGADGKMIDTPAEGPTEPDPDPENPDPTPGPDTEKQGLVKDEDGKIRFYEDGIVQYAGIVKDAEGNFYYVNSTKTAVTNCTYSIGTAKTNGLVPAGTYKFGADGKMLNPPATEPSEPNPDPEPEQPELKQGLVKDADGKIRFYKDGEPQYAGLVQDDEGNYYYINSYRAAVTDCVYAIGAAKTNGLLPAGTYKFGPDGKMIR